MMITGEMFAVFDRSQPDRWNYYRVLLRLLIQMNELLVVLHDAQRKDGYLDFGVAGPEKEYWIALTRPGMPPSRPGFPRRDLDLIEYLMEWAAGVRNHADTEMMEMNLRYPDCRDLPVLLMDRPATYFQWSGAVSWLKRALKSILK
jgi:hypothetical protein